MIAAPYAADFDQARAEVAREIRPAELVVEARGADRPIEHDRERRSDAIGLARQRSLPRLAPTRHVEMRDREADEPGFRFRAAAGRAFVADLAARARGRAGKRRDRGRVVVRLDLHHEVHGFRGVAVDAGLRVRPEPAALGADDDRRVVLVRRQHAARRVRVRIADHREQAFRRGLAVDQPVGVEDLVPAMLGVRLREHRQLGVGRVAAELAVRRFEVLDLVVAQGQPELDVGL